MGTYVALLRSINVGGRNRLPMADLRRLVEALGFADVATYVQSGNVVFSGRGAAAGIARTISGQITTEFGLDVPVVVRTAGRLRTVLDGNPFPDVEAEPTSLHVTFLGTQPDPEGVTRLEAEVEAEAETGRFGHDRLAVRGDHVYLHCPGGYGETKLNNAFLERRLGATATTRNWRTVVTLAGMAGLAV